MPKWVDQQDALSRVVGSTINFMQFIVDYLIIGFSDKGALSVFVWPEVHRNDSKFRFDDNGYRDALCEFIGESVTAATIDENETILIQTGKKNYMTIALAEYPHSGERAILTAPKHYLYVL